MFSWAGNAAFHKGDNITEGIHPLLLPEDTRRILTVSANKLL